MMQIKLNNIQFTEIDYKVETFDKEISSEIKTSLKFNTVFIPENDKEYILEFYLSLKNPNPSFYLNLKVCAHFSTTEAMNDEFKNSSFLDINSPAIVFPYIRTFISNLTLNSGYNPIVLPMFNFVKIAEDKSKKSLKK